MPPQFQIAFLNINDIVLISVMLECFVLAVVLFVTKHGQHISNRILAFFLLANSVYAFDTLTYWSIPINSYFASVSYNLFFIFGFAYLLKGPLLYLYAKSVIYKGFRLKRLDFIHFIPALAYPAYLYAIYYRLADADKASIISNFDTMMNFPQFALLKWAQDIGVLFYGAYTLNMFLRHERYLKGTYAHYRKETYFWLRTLIYGFILIWAWVLLSYLQGWFVHTQVPFGTIGNYLHFILLNTLLVLGLNNSNILNDSPQIYSIKKSVIDDEHVDDRINQLKHLMEQEKRFKNVVTLERLADEMDVSEKYLSAIINKHFQKNFFEFVNFYRVEEAKRLLLEESNESILAIMKKSGFKSKSAFNRFFLKYVSMTPSQYKRQHRH